MPVYPGALLINEKPVTWQNRTRLVGGRIELARSLAAEQLTGLGFWRMRVIKRFCYLSPQFHKYDNVLFVLTNLCCYAVSGGLQRCLVKVHTRSSSPEKSDRNCCGARTNIRCRILWWPEPR